MKIAPKMNGHSLFSKLIALLFTIVIAYPAFSANKCNYASNCEDDFIKPIIEFPDFPDVVTGDTMYFDCMIETIGLEGSQAIVTDNCDPNPLFSFGEFCIESGDCSNGYKYLAKCIWTAVDNNNNVSMFTIYAAIVDNTPPLIKLEWGENITSGDTLYFECGEAENFNATYISVKDECDLSIFCEDEGPQIDVFFQESVNGRGDCSEYVTEMYCAWVAIDECGNRSVFELIIFLTDTTPPEFVGVPDQYCGSASMTESEFHSYRQSLDTISIVDGCTAVDLTYNVDEISDGCSYLIEWEAVDVCGNTSYLQQTVCIVTDDCVGQISGTVKIDNNKDRVGDDPISDVTIFLIEDTDSDGMVDGGETVYLTTTTDMDGFYRFIDVPQGCYVLVELQPNGLDDTRDEDVTNPGNTDLDGTDDPTNNLIPVCVIAGEFDDGNDFVEQQFVLDVELISFEAKFIHYKNEVILNWATAYEIDSDYFIVERSLDGLEFESLDKIKSSGKNSKAATYKYVDQDVPNTSIMYYRLNEFSIDGSNTHSDIVSIEISNPNNAFLIYPNPSTGAININFQGMKDMELKEIELFDITGKVIQMTSTTANSFALELSNLEKGTYLLRINSNNKTYVEKIILTN